MRIGIQLGWDVSFESYGPAIGRADMIAIFFFQAEDGIRDYKVTGVQTCALPISLNSALLPSALNSRHRKSARRERSIRISPSPPTDSRCVQTLAAREAARLGFTTCSRLSIRMKSFPLPDSFMKGMGFTSRVIR